MSYLKSKLSSLRDNCLIVGAGIFFVAYSATLVVAFATWCSLVAVGAAIIAAVDKVRVRCSACKA